MSNFVFYEEPSLYDRNNLSAVLQAGHALGVDLSKVNFDEFPGIARRKSILYQSENRSIVEDYAHHPTEINAFLSHRRSVLPKHSLQVVFQPHRFTRTLALAKNFAEELALADDLFASTYLHMRNLILLAQWKTWLVIYRLTSKEPIFFQIFLHFVIPWESILTIMIRSGSICGCWRPEKWACIFRLGKVEW